MRFSLIPCFSALFLLSSCLGAQAPAPVSTYGASAGSGSTGIHTVQGRETLYSISNRYKIEMRDIAYLNNLDAPFALKSGQRLKLPPPREYTVRPGDTLYKVSRLFNTGTSDVARQNNLSAPYSLKTGQVLRMPSSVPAPRPSPVMRLASIVTPQTKPTPPYLAPPQQAAAQSSQYLSPPAKAESSTVQAQPRNQLPHGYSAAGGMPSVQAASSLPRPVQISATPPERSSSRFLMPVSGQVVSSYGSKKNGLHNDGINIAAPRGTPVKAAENGVVVYVGNELRGTGNLVLVRHADRYMSAYAHLEEFTVRRGQTITRGQTIGTVGSTGAVSSPQLHFEIRQGTQAIDPKGYIGI